MNRKNKLLHLEKKAADEAKLDQDLLVLTVMSSLLAVLGVKMDNTYVLIGSMLVSPFFDPVVSSVVFYASKKRKAFFIALRSLFVSLFLALIVSMVFWTGLMMIDTVQLSSIVGAQQTLFDTFAVAILTGIVGTLLWVWPKTSNTSAGVAIAISLVPPLVHVSAGIVMLDAFHTIESSLILLLNIIGIYVGSLLVLHVYLRGTFFDKA